MLDLSSTTSFYIRNQFGVTITNIHTFYQHFDKKIILVLRRCRIAQWLGSALGSRCKGPDFKPWQALTVSVIMLPRILSPQNKHNAWDIHSKDRMASARIEQQSTNEDSMKHTGATCSSLMAVVYSSSDRKCSLDISSGERVAMRHTPSYHSRGQSPENKIKHLLFY